MGEKWGWAWTARELQVPAKNAAQPLFFPRLESCESHRIAIQAVVIEAVIGVRAQQIGQSAGHARPHIVARWTKDDDYAGGHVFASVAAHPLNHPPSAPITYPESLSRAAPAQQFPRPNALPHIAPHP